MSSRTGRSPKGRRGALLWFASISAVPLTVGMLSSCHTAPPAAPEVKVETRTKVIDTACDWTRPIYLDKADVLSDATARAVLAHNQAGAKECGWKPLSAGK